MQPLTSRSSPAMAAAFGVFLSTALVASACLLVVGIWAIDASARLVMDRPEARWGASLLWVLLVTTPPFINHNRYSSLLATVVAWCFLRILPRDGAGGREPDGRSRAWVAGSAGALSGTVLYVLQPKGLFLVLVGMATLVIREFPGGPPSWRAGRRCAASRATRGR